MNNQKRIIVGVSVVAILLVVAIGVTYSLWSKTFIQTGENRLLSDCFHLSFEEVKGTSIQLENTFPMTDQEGQRLKPYRFKVKNNCDAYAKYSVLLDVPTSVRLKAEYLKVKLDRNPANLLSSYPLDESNKDTSKNVYILDNWHLKFQEEREYSFYVWIDENVTQEMEGVQNATWSGKIRISAAYASEGYGMLRKISSSDTEGMWGYKENITKIVIQNKLEPIENAEASYDESILQDGSVMSYVVANEDGSYTGYLQSNRELNLNSGENLFRNFTNTTEILGLEYINTSNITNMTYMFRGMSSLTSLDVSHFDTSKVTNMAGMFWGMPSLTNLDISHFDTSNVTSMGVMFSGMKNLTNLDLSSFDTSKVVYMHQMFWDMSSLTHLDVSNFDTSNVIDMQWMFRGLSSLTYLDVSNFNTSKVINMAYMFCGLENLISLDVSHFDTGNVTNMSGMFWGMSSLTDLDVSHFNTSKVTDMSYMFNELIRLEKLNIDNLDTSNVTNMAYMFYGLENLISLDVSHFDTSNVTNMEAMFYLLRKIKTLEVNHFNTSNLENARVMFSFLDEITYLDLSNWDTSKVINMRGMFSNMKSLQNLNLSSFDTRRVSNFSCMFAWSSTTNIIYGNNFIYANDADVDLMFSGCLANKPTHESWNEKL